MSGVQVKQMLKNTYELEGNAILSGPKNDLASRNNRRLDSVSRKVMTARGRIAVLGVLFALLASSAAHASPWAEVGDPQLRSDIEILAAADVIDGITTHWPLPWASIVTRLRGGDALQGQPDYVREAAERVLHTAQSQMRFGEVHAKAVVDATNEPSVVRGFDGLGREPTQGQISVEYVGTTTAFRLSAGAEVHDDTGRTAFVPDNSYVAQKIGGAVLYAGYLTHWWGPGWISALSLSNNARPFPQIGIERDETSAFQTPWLSWLGPWQAEFMFGWLNDPRINKNTLYDALRFTANPAKGLEIGLSLTEEFCGTGHVCVPIKNITDFSNSNAHPNTINAEGVFDVHYSRAIGGVPFEVYTQFMNEDSSPIVHSGTTHMVGGSVWLPLMGNLARVTAEYTDSVATRNIFSFGTVLHGFSYNNGTYPDGMRYRGRTIGFSLDSDSTLLTLQAAWRDDDQWAYTLSLHHAAVSNPHNPSGNVVTTAPVHINLGEARVAVPFHDLNIVLAARLQDDQPRPDHGFEASIEAAITYNF